MRLVAAALFAAVLAHPLAARAGACLGQGDLACVKGDDAACMTGDGTATLDEARAGAWGCTPFELWNRDIGRAFIGPGLGKTFAAHREKVRNHEAPKWPAKERTWVLKEAPKYFASPNVELRCTAAVQAAFAGHPGAVDVLATPECRKTNWSTYINWLLAGARHPSVVPDTQAAFEALERKYGKKPSAARGEKMDLVFRLALVGDPSALPWLREHAALPVNGDLKGTFELVIAQLEADAASAAPKD